LKKIIEGRALETVDTHSSHVISTLDGKRRFTAA